MNRLLFTIFFACCCLSLLCAQDDRCRIHTFTDRDLYLTGETMHLRVSISTVGDAQPEQVAYVEIVDRQRLHTQAMMWLSDGVGMADVVLPSSMHSGYYQLNVYTRSMRNHGSRCCYRAYVPVVNLLQVSRHDHVSFRKVPVDSLALEASAMENALASSVAMSSVVLTDKKVYSSGEVVTISVPHDVLASPERTLSVTPLSCISDGYYPVHQPEYHQSSDLGFESELYGHLVMARAIEPDSIGTSRLAVVGKAPHIYDGYVRRDGTILFHTSGYSGSLPVMINGYTADEQPSPVELQSPYATILADSLPLLRVVYSEAELSARSLQAQAEEFVRQGALPDSLPHDPSFMGVAPDYVYDLDEYTRFKTVREILLEFVRGVQRQKSHGRNQLFTTDPDTGHSADCPALVLLDGVPVYDLDAFLDYDARRLKYVHIYTDRFTFGKSFCQGVISFITHSGRLANYRLDAGSRLYTYAFPQRSDAGAYAPQWVPSLSDNYSFVAPSQAGLYQLVIKGCDALGCELRYSAIITVTE